MHPLINNLTELPDDQLEKKIFELNNRISLARRSGSSILSQLYLCLEDYQAEFSRRQEVKMNEIMKNNKSLGDVINIS
jgi:hypothetical protein